MATAHTTHTSHKEGNEHEKKEEPAKESAKKEPIKSPGQIAAERAGQDVPEEDQGKPTDAREWLGQQQEREERAAIEKLKSELATKHATKSATK